MHLIQILLLPCTAILLTVACKNENKSTQNQISSKDSVVELNLETEMVAPMNEEGLNIDYYNNGKERMKGVIKEGKREGLWQAWYENGNLWSEAEYKNGTNHGISVTYFESGKKRYEGKFETGKKIGIWKYYNEKGELVKSIPSE